MGEPTVYKLYLQPGMKVILWVILAVFIGVGVFTVSWSLFWHDPKAPPLAFGLIWIALVAIYLVYSLSLPHRITLAQDGTIEFTSVLQRRTVRADEISSIKPEGSKLGFFVVRTARHKIRLLAQFDGFHDFLTRLQGLHPGVELRGC